MRRNSKNVDDKNFCRHTYLQTHTHTSTDVVVQSTHEWDIPDRICGGNMGTTVWKPRFGTLNTDRTPFRKRTEHVFLKKNRTDIFRRKSQNYLFASHRIDFFPRRRRKQSLLFPDSHNFVWKYKNGDNVTALRYLANELWYSCASRSHSVKMTQRFAVNAVKFKNPTSCARKMRRRRQKKPQWMDELVGVLLIISKL